jgi:hypothetical protein
MLKGEKPMNKVKLSTKKPTKVDTQKALEYFKNTGVNKASTITAKMVDNIKGDTDFDKLANLITGNFEGATATKKCVRFAIKGARFSCWRRTNNIRIYTNNPAIFGGVEWAPDTHEQGLTHSAYTSYKVIANWLTPVDLTKAKK